MEWCVSQWVYLEALCRWVIALPKTAFIWLPGEMRVQWFETLSEGWLKLAQRKIVVFPYGIYTITYRQAGVGQARWWRRCRKGGG